MYKDILLPIDLQETDSWKNSLPVAIDYASAFNAVLHIMTVVPNFGMNVWAPSFRTTSRRRLSLRWTSSCMTSSPRSCPAM